MKKTNASNQMNKNLDIAILEDNTDQDYKSNLTLN